MTTDPGEAITKLEITNPFTFILFEIWFFFLNLQTLNFFKVQLVSIFILIQLISISSGLPRAWRHDFSNWKNWSLPRFTIQALIGELNWSDLVHWCAYPSTGDLAFSNVEREGDEQSTCRFQAWEPIIIHSGVGACHRGGDVPGSWWSVSFCWFSSSPRHFPYRLVDIPDTHRFQACSIEWGWFWPYLLDQFDEKAFVKSFRQPCVRTNVVENYHPHAMVLK